MAARSNRCRPNLWHLSVLLFASLCLITFVICYLNSYFDKRYGDAPMAFLPSEAHHNFKADFRTLPHTLPRGRRRLIVLVDSNWRNYDRRLAIRNSWALNQHRLNCSIFFVVGDADHNEIVGVTDEGAFFHDIIQPTVWESEKNTVLKLLAAFRFVETELDSDFVMKTNDDVFVNLPELVDFLQPYIPAEEDHVQKHMADYLHVNTADSDRPKGLVFGNRIQDATPHNDPNKPGFLSPHFWPKHAPFPEYAWGKGYVVSFDVMRRFNICPKVLDLLPLEDVYFTGMCRQHFGLQLHHDDKFAQSQRLNIPCLWKSKFITAGVKHGDMETVWNTVNKKSTPKC